MNSKQQKALIEATMINRLGILILGLVLMIIVCGTIKNIADRIIPDVRDAFLISATAQCLLAFILPSWLAARLCSSDAAGYLRLTRDVAPRQFLGAFLLLLFMTPAMNAVIEWNESLSLPASMSDLESYMRALEDSAADTTLMILGDPSVWGLVSGIVVVGCLTGFAEEVFFRGGLQNALTSGRVNPHAAIWITAFVFSFMHFQFFGFVPRLLLGATFGYLYHYTRSQWVSAFAHAFNNSVVVVSSWLSARGLTEFDVDRFLSGQPSSWWIPVVSVIMTVFLVMRFGKLIFIPVRK